MDRFASATAIVLMLSAPVLSRQGRDPQPTFRAAVDLVQVDAYVTDAQEKPVTGLTVNDFELKEDGKMQAITHFLPSYIPVDQLSQSSPSAKPFIESDVQSNEPREGRLYVIAVDDLRPENGLRTRLFLRRFVEQFMGENDLAAVVLIGHGRRSDTQEFTSNRRLLLRAIDLISGWPTDGPPVLGFSRGGARERMAALQELVEFLAKIPSRRKAVLLLTEDIGLDVRTNAIDASVSIAGDIAREMIRTALRANVTMYPIDPNRLTLADIVSGESESALSIEMDRNRRQAELSRVLNLRTLADVTGGFALVSSNDVDAAFERLVRENSVYYSLGYYSSQDKPDGKFRRLEVRVKRPGLRVHTINGYLAPKERNADAPKPSGVVDVLRSPLAISRIPMRVAAAAYKADGDEVAVAGAVEVDGRALEFDKKGDAFTAQLEVGYVAVGANGITPPVHYRVDLALKPDTYEKARKSGIRVLFETRLRPGLYQLRVGVSQIGGVSGSVLYDLDVPDFTKSSLAVSGLSLVSAETSGQHVSTGRNVTTGVMPGPMTATREFTAADRIAIYTEVYDNIGESSPHTVTVRAGLTTENGVPVKTIVAERSSAMMVRRQGGHRFLFEMPLSGVAAGPYVIHVEANSTVDNRPTVSRSVPIRVR